MIRITGFDFPFGEIVLNSTASLRFLIISEKTEEALALIRYGRYPLCEDGISNLIHAVRHENIPVITALLENASPEYIDFVDPQGDLGTALHRAADNGQEEIVRLLLRAGANPNSKDGHPKCKRTPLQIAAMQVDVRREHLQIVELLLQAGADVCYVDKENQSALDEAVNHFVFSFNLNPTPEHLAELQIHRKMISLLVAYGADYTHILEGIDDPKERRAVRAAIEEGRLERAKREETTREVTRGKKFPLDSDLARIVEEFAFPPALPPLPEEPTEQ